MSQDDRYIDISNARLEEQQEVMRRIAADGVCPFCEEHLFDYHTEPILKRGTYWLITKNRWPYEGSKHHFLAISTTHIASFNDLAPEAGAELFTLFQEVAREFNITTGGLGLRFGTGSNSVKHIHAHFIEPDTEDPEHKGVKFSLSKDRRPKA